MTLENVDDVYPLAPLQEGMLFHSVSAPGSGVFIQQVVSTLQGNLDTARLEACWSQMLAKYPVLRTAFLWDGLDEPLQVVRGEVEISWLHEDWSNSDQDHEERMREWLQADRRQDFDLAQAPLSRMSLFKLAPQNWKWVWTFHHIQCDGWSTHLLLKELWERYNGGELTDAESPSIPRLHCLGCQQGSGKYRKLLGRSAVRP